MDVDVYTTASHARTLDVVHRLVAACKKEGIVCWGDDTVDAVLEDLARHGVTVP